MDYRVASTNCSMGQTLRTLCLKMVQFQTILFLACCSQCLPMDARYVFNQNPRIDLSLKQSSARSIDPKFSFESLPQLTIMDPRGRTLNVCPAKLPPTQSRKAVLVSSPNARFTLPNSSILKSLSYPSFFSSLSQLLDRLIPNMVLLMSLVERYCTAILLTLDAAALRRMWLAFRWDTISQRPMTERGLMENMESSQSERAVT